MAKRSGVARAAGKILVLGVGNVLLTDEGAGVRALEALEAGFQIPERVTLVDGGTGGASLVPLLHKHDDVIVIDAVRGGGDPGSVYSFGIKELKMASAKKSSAHQIGVAEMVEIAAFEGFNPNVRVIGIEPADLRPGLELTDEVKGAIPKAVAAVRKELKRLGVLLEDKTNKTEDGAASGKSGRRGRPTGRGKN